MRNIYYQDPDLFKSQSHVDELVDNLAFTLGVGRNALNIVRTTSTTQCCLCNNKP